MIVTVDVGLKNLAFCIMECENPKELSTNQMLEIVSQKQYKTPGLILG